MIEIRPKAGLLRLFEQVHVGADRVSVSGAAARARSTAHLQTAAETAFRRAGLRGFCAGGFSGGGERRFCLPRSQHAAGNDDAIRWCRRRRGRAAWTRSALMRRTCGRALQARAGSTARECRSLSGQPEQRLKRRAFMRLALREAVKGTGFTSPNPLVGAVAVKDGALLGQGVSPRVRRHARGDRAAAQASRPEQARGATVYVNLEPCCHVGKTPPCTEALMRAGVARVVVGHERSESAGGGTGHRAICARRESPWMSGVLEAEARELNAPFLTYITKRAAVDSAEGRADRWTGGSRWPTGNRAGSRGRRRGGKFTGCGRELDAVMVGSVTVIEDDPELTVRHIRGRDPLRIVVDSHLRVPLHSKILARRGPRAHMGPRRRADAPAENDGAIEETGATLLDMRGGRGRQDRSAGGDGAAGVARDHVAVCRGRRNAARVVHPRGACTTNSSWRLPRKS